MIREPPGGSAARETALACVEAGIEATLPARVVREHVTVSDGVLAVEDATYDLADYDRVLVVGGGKASARVAAALEPLLGDRLDGGVVVTTDPTEADHVDVVEAGHPIPDERGIGGARRVLDLVSGADERTLVLAVLGGGGSALLPAPAGDLELADLRAVTGELLAAGAPIRDLNAVRKHCSSIKGGRLARGAAPATVVGLILSDVVGDDIATIASGPTAPDDTTYADAVAVLDRYGVDVPAVRTHLEAGAAGNREETPGPDDPAFERVDHHVLASGTTALDAASQVGSDRGYEPLVLSSRVRGEASVAALTHVAVAEEIRATGHPLDPPAVVLSGGETTVTVEGDGRGGPNQEFALAAGIEFAGLEAAQDEVALASVDTDGRDGGTDAAGALVDPETVEDPARAREALDANDAYPYLDERAALVRTGATGTNVNDLRVLVVERVDRER